MGPLEITQGTFCNKVQHDKGEIAWQLELQPPGFASYKLGDQSFLSLHFHLCKIDLSLEVIMEIVLDNNM